ncbi:protein of unknown function [Pseudomonas inefficax]|uniref:Uncharacterized protein n=1 Tax=Pseudomonas inefficax TaxID=2078786 RepID=A0AAQ1SV69_9PSED|nr:protein of unknown function [Pseudomonas inefficax]
MCRQGRPFRGHARSHRVTTGFKTCAVPVGAGVPAKRPVQAVENFRGFKMTTEYTQFTVERPIWMTPNWAFVGAALCRERAAKQPRQFVL